MDLPIILVNFKVYEEAVGEKALVLARIHEKVAKDLGVNIAIAVGPLDLALVAKSVDIPVFAQHVDALGYGSGTGKIVPHLVKKMGASGTLLNHAENQLDNDVLRASIVAAHEAGLFVVACANTPEKGKEIEGFGPDLIAIEPPELIGGDVSVSKAQANVIVDAVELIGGNKVLVGAGIKDAEDVRLALKYGAKGVLLASGVINASDPEAVLRDLASGIN